MQRDDGKRFLVMKVEYIQCILGFESVGIDDARRHHLPKLSICRVSDEREPIISGFILRVGGKRPMQGHGNGVALGEKGVFGKGAMSRFYVRDRHGCSRNNSVGFLRDGRVSMTHTHT